MRGIVKIDDGAVVHVIPRAEVRYVAVHTSHDDSDDHWALEYQLAGCPDRSIAWTGDCRPPTLRNDRISVGEYNQIAAQSVQTMITRGHRDLHLERRSDGVVLVRSGHVEQDARVVLCRCFVAEMAFTARQTAIGPLDDARLQMLYEIGAAARDLVLPDWYPLKSEGGDFHVSE